MAPLLELENVSAELGNVPVLRDLSIALDSGETVGLLGRNGAGKTTTFRTIMGLVPVLTGQVRVDSENITAASAEQRTAYGLSLAPEDRRLFTNLSVRENLQMAAWGRDESVDDDTVDDVVDLATTVFPEMDAFITRPAGQLSGGQQKMVAISRALAADPDVLLLDEPFEGLAPATRDNLIAGIDRIQDLGIAILVAESNVRYASQVGDRFYVIERGEIETEITDEDPQTNETVKRIFEGG